MGLEEILRRGAYSYPQREAIDDGVADKENYGQGKSEVKG